MSESVRVHDAGVFVRKKGDWWYIRWRIPGTPERERALRTREQATAVAKGRERARAWDLGTYDPWSGGSAPDEARGLTLGQAVDRFEAARAGVLLPRTLHDYTEAVKRFAESVLPRGLDADLATISSSHIHAYLHGADGSTLALSTRRGYDRRLRLVFGWFAEAGLIERSPLDGIEKPRKAETLPQYFTDDDLERLFSAIDWWHSDENPKRRFIADSRRGQFEHWASAAFRLILATGLRRAEAARLAWGDVVLPVRDDAGALLVPGTVTVRSERRSRGDSGQTQRSARTKGRSERAVTLSPAAVAVLEELAGYRVNLRDPDEPVLKNETGADGVSEDYLSRRMLHYRRLAGLPEGLDVHGLRHTFAVRFLAAGGQLVELKEELGHRSIDTTMKYTKLRSGHRARRVAELYEQAAASPGPPGETVPRGFPERALRPRIGEGASPNDPQGIGGISTQNEKDIG